MESIVLGYNCRILLYEVSLARNEFTGVPGQTRTAITGSGGQRSVQLSYGDIVKNFVFYSLGDNPDGFPLTARIIAGLFLILPQGRIFAPIGKKL